LARQAGERDGQLGATANPHAGQAGAINPDILRHRWPDHGRRDGVAKAGTAHVLFIRVERLVASEMSTTTIWQVGLTFIAVKYIFYPPGGIVDILPGG
jgi:hypothetical protein